MFKEDSLLLMNNLWVKISFEICLCHTFMFSDVLCCLLLSFVCVVLNRIVLR